MTFNDAVAAWRPQVLPPQSLASGASAQKLSGPGWLPCWPSAPIRPGRPMSGGSLLKTSPTRNEARALTRGGDHVGSASAISATTTGMEHATVSATSNHGDARRPELAG